jgi:D-alanyl-D-alanine carboxypeptidase
MDEFRQKQNTVAIMFVNVFAVLFAGIYAVPVFFYKDKIIEKTQPIIPAPIVIPKPDPFLNVSLNAEAAYVYDVSTGKVLYSKNEEAQLPLASVTKVMTALVASHAPENTTVDVSAKDLADGPGGLYLGEKWNLKDLLNYTLVISSNSGANAIAGAAGAVLADEGGLSGENEDVFIDQMNATAKKIGMAQTYYLNPSGLDVNEDLSGGYGSARDMAKLFEYVIKVKPLLLSATAYDALQFDSQNGVSHRAENTNVIAKFVPGLLASKTGYTLLANGNLVIAFDVGPMHPVIVSVLGSTQEGRFTDVQKLVDASILKISQGE